MPQCWLVCYDISDNRARRRGLRILRAHSNGYQDSCFEVMAGKRTLSALLTETFNLLDTDTDRLLLMPLNSFSACWQIGRGPITPTGPLLVIN